MILFAVLKQIEMEAKNNVFSPTDCDGGFTYYVKTPTDCDGGFIYYVKASTDCDGGFT